MPFRLITLLSPRPWSLLRHTCEAESRDHGGPWASNQTPPTPPYLPQEGSLGEGVSRSEQLQADKPPVLPTESPPLLLLFGDRPSPRRGFLGVSNVPGTREGKQRRLSFLPGKKSLGLMGWPGLGVPPTIRLSEGRGLTWNAWSPSSRTALLRCLRPEPRRLWVSEMTG